MSKLKGKKPGETLPGKTKGLIFGKSGWGKTWFATSFPAPYFIDTEHGATQREYQSRLEAAGGAYLGQEDGALDFAVILQEMKTLATEKHAYKTLIIDSITKVFQVAIANEAERLGDKDAFGASKKPAIAYMRQIINWATKLDMNIWFVAHEVPEWGINPKNGNREEVGRVPDVWDKLVYELDIAIQAVRRGKDYPSIGVVHKSRLKPFPLGEAFPLEYDEFAQRYGKAQIERETQVLTLADAATVAEITRLVSVLNVSPVEVGKILTKAAAASWEELTMQQAEKTLGWLNNKIKGGDEK